METRFLETFVAVAEKGSFAEAARRLDLTPAAIAQRIRALESEIGVPLLSRSGRTVSPTEAGVAILGQTRILLKQVRDLGSIATSGQPTGELRLGAISSALSGLLPTVLKVLLQRCRASTSTFCLEHPRTSTARSSTATSMRPSLRSRRSRSLRLVIGNWFGKSLWSCWSPHRHRRAMQMPLWRPSPSFATSAPRWGGRLVDGYLRRAGIRPRERYELQRARRDRCPRGSRIGRIARAELGAALARRLVT